MNVPSKRMPVIANHVLSQGRKLSFTQRLFCQTSPLWDCDQCSDQSSLLTVQNGAASPLNKSTARRVRPYTIRLRALSSSSSRRGGAKSRDDLPSKEEGRRSPASKRFDHLMDNIQSNIFTAGQRLNDLTGYSGIEALKKEIEQQEIFVQETRGSLQNARDAYTKAISQRSASQREVNELLQRKHAWSPTDLERFTELYRSDHANEQAESAAQQQLAEADRIAEEAAALLSRTILARYHEEQIWSDKIRRMSTWGTWGLMGVNVLLFLVFQIGVEPWRRKRLVKGFEEKVMDALERENLLDKRTTNERQADDDVAVEEAIISDISADGQRDASPDASIPSSSLKVVGKKGPSKTMAAGVPPANATGFAAPTPRTMDLIIRSIQDLFSNHQIPVRRIDLTMTALEGAAAGMVFTGLFVFLLRPR